MIRQNELDQLERMLKQVSEDTALDSKYKVEVMKALQHLISMMYLNDYLSGTVFPETLNNYVIFNGTLS